MTDGGGNMENQPSHLSLTQIHSLAGETLCTCSCSTGSHVFPISEVIKVAQTGLTSLGVFYVAVLWRIDEPQQQVLPGRVQVPHLDVIGGELHSATFLDLINQSSRVKKK